MYKFILAFGLLFIITNYLNCMELSSSAKIYTLKSDKDVTKLKCMIDIAELEKIESRINNSEDIFYEAATLIPHLESITVQKKAEKNIIIEEFVELMIEQCAIWFIEKIVNDRLLEYSETDSIRLLFEKGITLSERINTIEGDVIAQDSNLPNLPNELLLIIFIKGLDLAFDPIEPIGIDEINRQNNFFTNFFTNFLSVFCEGKSNSIIEKGLRDGSNAELRMATIKGIKYIKNIMLINKNFYLFVPELINGLKSKISSELLYEKIFELFRKRKNYSLMLFFGKSTKDRYKF